MIGRIMKISKTQTKFKVWLSLEGDQQVITVPKACLRPVLKPLERESFRQVEVGALEKQKKGIRPTFMQSKGT